MKRLALLTVCLFLLGTPCVFAQTTSSVITSQVTNMHEVTNYNAFGVAVSGTQINTTTTTSTNEKNQASTTVTVSTSQLQSLGGSLKIVSSHLVSDSTNPDAATSHAEGDTTYTYNGSGQLSGASGTMHTTGNRGNDAKGAPMGTFASDTTDTYDIRNGQALRTQSVTTGTNTGVGANAQNSTFNETTTYNYALTAGSWQEMSETTHSRSDSRDGGFQDTTTVKTFQRNSDGVVTGLTQTKTGTMFQAAGQSGGTTAGTHFTLAYTATTAFDPQTGWHIDRETTDWNSVAP